MVVARPKACVSRSNSPRVNPGSARTVFFAGLTRMPFISERSIMRPLSQTDFPATLWPPPDDHSCPFVSGRKRKSGLAGPIAIGRVQVGVTNSACDNFHQGLSRSRLRHGNFFQ